MKIANREIGPNHPPLVIAEIGINHGGDLTVAKEMVRLAAGAGCEMVKHQTHIIDDEMTEEAKSIFPPNADVSIWHVMERCALSLDEEAELKRYTESLGMIWISTPFSRAAADFLETLDVPAYKIGSGEADNLPLIRHIARKGKPVILSTGMQTIETIRRSVAILDAAGIDYALLECTNLYPSPPEIVSLQGVTDLKAAFPRAVVGFSDHSIGPEMALASVALGACILERHYTDTRYRKGPDITCSMDPAELRFLIDRSREIHTALHNPKRRTEAEEPVYRFARASVVADRDLPDGHVIAEADIWARRPGSGEIAGYDFDKVIGKRLKRAVTRNTQLKWGDLG
ncbi:MAG: N-acetylneuraminate synthase family protein [Tabrizicola sp.]|uniref:N-acetylneuraminate synthase family protein n=1 Tax=Tabrizicola sp. TaxID=2005166 RepID=UPI00273443FA|nr:N-acetylneuraminate synthase family protein [Tabrizicola sp.]MDP3263779.1 N-acetylneuraminate synthase family protein [Tabrizicola sp.]MDP3647143.1 N-acetylneuraminate synthase family protein [Paracoccaceae bacterium]MDZ4067981.1 N-acetylneuraminate synthase family protein [Tabrizicola sp.]